MSTLSTHILDISTGKPAQGVRVYLEQDGGVLATAFTNAQGRITAFIPFLPAGRYRLVAEIGAWFTETGRDTLYPTCTPLTQVSLILRSSPRVISTNSCS